MGKVTNPSSPPPPNSLLILPDGGSPVVERLEWKTDFSKPTLSGFEWRRACRAVPRYSYTGDYRLAASLSGAMSGNGAREAVLAALRTRPDSLIPLSCHISDVGMESGAGLADAATQQVQRWVRGSSGPSYVTAGTVRPAGWFRDIPLYDAWLSAERSIAHDTNSYRKAQLTFQLKAPFIEVFSPALAPLALGAEIAFRHNWIESVKESVSQAEDVYDNDHLIVRKVRYVKRQLSVLLSLTTRAEIVEFRRFLFQIKGRFMGFALQSNFTPSDPTASGYVQQWRLASDAVEIEYVSRSYAKVKLQIVSVPQ